MLFLRDKLIKVKPLKKSKPNIIKYKKISLKLFFCSHFVLMSEEERENFYRNSTLIVDHSNEVVAGLIDYYASKKGFTLYQFIQSIEHDIYHLCYNNRVCCKCPPSVKRPLLGHNNRILQQSQLDILLDVSTGCTKSQHCCCSANSNIKLEHFDLALAKCLIINFPSIISLGSAERQAVDKLGQIRNKSYGHARNGRIPQNEYQLLKSEIENCLLILARVQGKEQELKQKLADAAKRPLDNGICNQFQTTLLEMCLREETRNTDLQALQVY